MATTNETPPGWADGTRTYVRFEKDPEHGHASINQQEGGGWTFHVRVDDIGEFNSIRHLPRDVAIARAETCLVKMLAVRALAFGSYGDLHTNEADHGPTGGE